MFWLAGFAGRWLTEADTSHSQQMGDEPVEDMATAAARLALF